MSKAKSNVRLFESDGYSFKLWLYPPDAEEMRANGEIEVAFDSRDGHEIGYKLRDRHKPANRKDDGAISFSEIKVNAGEPPKPQVYFLDPHYEKSVRIKVQEWRGAWDRKSAPTVIYA